MWEIIYILWSAINIIALSFWFVYMYHYDGWVNLLIFPNINKHLENKGMSKKDIILCNILLVVLFLPGLISYYVGLAAFIIFSIVLVWILDTIENIRKK